MTAGIDGLDAIKVAIASAVPYVQPGIDDMRIDTLTYGGAASMCVQGEFVDDIIFSFSFFRPKRRDHGTRPCRLQMR